MTRIRLLGIAVGFSSLMAYPASAQHMIDEPGMYAFYHPNGDLGIAAPRAPLDAQAMAPRLVMRHAMPMHHRIKMRK